MQLEHRELTIETDERKAHTITDRVRHELNDSDIEDGLCLVFSKHTTAGIVVNEDEPGLKQDMLDHLDRMAPPDAEYLHNQRGPAHDKNGDAHIKDLLTGPDHTLPVEDGDLALGAYQEIFLLEFDGPRERTVGVHLIGS
jgi:secondary thiamine-phosphate synthase enzyme